MDAIRRFSRPKLRRPRAIAAFEGWNDACDAASGALAYLLGQFDVEPFAVVEPEEFFDFQSRRPVVEVDAGGNRGVSWPLTRCFAIPLPDAEQDLLVVLGEEPHLRWKTFTRLIAQLFTEHDVEFVVTLGAFIGQVPHTLPVPLIGVATDPDIVFEHDLMTSRYEGPTGITGLLLEACREAGLPTLAVWAATPHYLAANPNPKAMRALLQKAADVMSLPIDTEELDEVVAEFDSRVDAAMEASDNFTEYVRKLEEADIGSDLSPLSSDPAASEKLIEDIEEFLREQG